MGEGKTTHLLRPWLMDQTSFPARSAALATWAKALEDWQTEIHRLARGGPPDSHRESTLKISLATASYRLSVLPGPEGSVQSPSLRYSMGPMQKVVLFLGVLVLVATAITGYRVHLIHELREPLLAKLGQPQAAQFRNEIYFGDWTVAGGTLCGEVAAHGVKGTGGGFQWFSVANGVFVEDASLRRQFDEAGINRCNADGRPANTPWCWLHW